MSEKNAGLPAADDKAGGELPNYYLSHDGHLMTPHRAEFLGFPKDCLTALYTHPQPQAVPDENRCIRELREYAAKNPGTYIFPGWDGNRVIKYLANDIGNPS